VTKLLAVAAREMRERWLLFPAALVVGCMPLVMPAFAVPRDAMPVVGAVSAALLGVAVAVITGATMLARDTANGRLGFLFSRPVSWPAIWGGKWLAALVLVVVSGLLAAIPWMLAYPPSTVGGHHGGSWFQQMLDRQGAALFLGAILLAVGIANFGATLFRSRSPWVAADLVLLLATFWGTRHYIAPMLLFSVLMPLGGWQPALVLAPLVAGLLAGSMAQVAVGRTDVRRAHGALSVGFWAVVAVTLVSAAGYWAWARSAGPADVTVHAVSPGPAGRWIDVEGSAERSGYYPHAFLIDTTSGRYAPLPGPSGDRSRFPMGLQFSADGRSAAVLWSDGRGASLRLYDLAGDTPRGTEVVLESSPPPTWSTTFALTPAATHALVVHESGASLFALPSGRRVATTTIPPGWRPALVRFLSEGEARAWLVPAMELRRGDPHGPARAEMRVVDLATDGRSRASTFPLAATLEPAWVWRGVVADASGKRLLTSDGGVRLRDGATGDLIATLTEGDSRLPALFLADGRVVVGSGANAPNDPRAKLLVFAPHGVKMQQATLELWPWGLSVGPEVAPGRVAVSSFRSSYLPQDTVVVDVGDGRVVERLSGLRPAIGFWMVPAVPADATPTTVHFFRDAGGRVVRIDFASGERKVVTGPGVPSGDRLRVD
jgi:hypothetical protein